MVCVRPAVANGLTFNGCGADSVVLMGTTPVPVGARGYDDAPTVLLLLTAAGGVAAATMLVSGGAAAGIVPVEDNAAPLVTLLTMLLLVVATKFSAAVGDCAFDLVRFATSAALSLPPFVVCAVGCPVDLPTVLVPSGLGKKNNEPSMVCSNFPCLSSLMTRVA